MTRSTVFLPATDRYLPISLALSSALVVLWATQLWGLTVLREQFAWLLQAQELASGAQFDFLAPSYPAGPFWSLLLAQFARTGFAIEFVTRIWQALMIGALLYVATRFYLRHIQSRAVVAGTAVALATGLLLLGEPFSLSPLMTALFLLTCGVLALSRFLLEEETFAFFGAALCFGLGALVWLPAVVMASGAALAILLGGRGNLSRRLSGVFFFSAMALLPACVSLIQNGLPERVSVLSAVIGAFSTATAWTMWSTWPAWVRIAAAMLVLVGLLYVYLITRGPAGIGPALKRRELQVWILLSFVWIGHLLIWPTTNTLAPLLTGFLLWPALGIDSFRDFAPVNKHYSGLGARVAAGVCAILLVIPLWQTVFSSLQQYQAGNGLRGFAWQMSPLIREVRHAKEQPLYSDQAELLSYVLSTTVRKLPDDLRSLELLEGSILILGDQCPPGICNDDSLAHPTLAFEPRLTLPQGMLYDIRFRPAEPALTASDSLTLP